jgi:hypothetical protein
MNRPVPRSIDELANEPIDDADAAALRDLARIYDALDPVPRGLVDRVKFGLTLDALHAEIAELQRSSGLVGVRAEAAGDVQSVTFTSATLTTMITVTPTSADRVRVDGWIAPGGGVAVELRGRTTTRHTVADPDGRFAFDDVAKGLAQFVLRPPTVEARPVVTPSIEI